MTFVKPAMSWPYRTTRDPPFWVFIVFLLPLVFFCWHLAIYGRRFITWLVPDIHIVNNIHSFALRIQEVGVQGVVLPTIIWAPIREEFLFRVLPFGVLFLLWRYFWKRVPPLWLSLALVLATSIAFGHSHGAFGNVFTQGSFGAVLALVYLAWGSYGKTPIRGVCAILLLHSLYNLYVAVWVQQHLHLLL